MRLHGQRQSLKKLILAQHAYEEGKVRIFGSMRDEVTGSLRKVYNEELHNYVYLSSPNIIRMIESRRTIWARNVAQMGRV
jgi:hypothetical protein